MSSRPVARGLRRTELTSDALVESARFCRDLLGWRAEPTANGIDCWVGERCCARIRSGHRRHPREWRPVLAGTRQRGTLSGPDGTEAALAAGRAQHGPWAPAPRAGEPCWVDLVTSDPVRADRFWAESLGWEVTTDAHGGDLDAAGGQYRVRGRALAARTTERGPAQNSPKAQDSQGTQRGWVCYFAVQDVVGATDRADGLGAATSPREHPVLGRIALVTGPEGATFGVAGLATGWGR